MSFENPQLGVEDLPAYQESEYTRLDPAYKQVLYGGAALFVIILLVPIIVIYFVNEFPEESSNMILSILFSLWFLISSLTMALIGPGFRQKGYAVRERDISYKTGLINRTTTTIPFNRVQHCDIKQGLISRYFGLSKLNVYTAGGAKSDLSIPGLSLAKTQKLMNYVLQKTLAYDEEE